jgi:hypothetical protein
MNVTRIVAEIDTEIQRLQQLRTLLVGVGKPGRGRPKGSTNKPARKKRRLSPEGRKRIAEAMKKRWAERRKQQAK